MNEREGGEGICGTDIGLYKQLVFLWINSWAQMDRLSLWFILPQTDANMHTSQCTGLPMSLKLNAFQYQILTDRPIIF